MLRFITMSALQDPETEYDDLGVIIDSLMEENNHLRTHLERILNALAEQTAKSDPDGQPVAGHESPDLRNGGSADADRRDHTSRPFEGHAVLSESSAANNGEPQAEPQAVPPAAPTQDVQLWVESKSGGATSNAEQLTVNSGDRNIDEFHRIAMADLERRLRNQEETVQDLIKLTRNLLQPG
jgi:hypothetical protein